MDEIKASFEIKDSVMGHIWNTNYKLHHSENQLNSKEKIGLS